MHSLELSLQVLVALEGSSHLFVDHVFIWNLEWNQELRSVGLPGQIWQSRNEPVQNVMAGLFLSVDDVSAVVGIEIAWVAKDFQEPADALLSLLLGLFLHVNCFMLLIEVGEDPVDELKKFERCFVVELHH